VNLVDIEQGATLPEVGVDITAKLIVGGAIASRDFQDVHHDKAAAQSLGTPDIFMNILTTNGLVGRYVTDWAGEGARLLGVDIRLGAPNFPGDRMVFSGEVAAVDPDSGQVVLSITGRNRLGDHVSGTATVQLPPA
jgi:acyl dehydratase